MGWQKICVLCFTIPDTGTIQDQKVGEAMMAVQSKIAPAMMQIVGLELGAHKPFAAAILPDTRQNLTPKEIYDGPLPEKMAPPQPVNVIPKQALVTFLAGINQPDCPQFEDKVFALEYRDNVIGKPFGKLIESAVQKDPYDRLARWINRDYSLPTHRIFEDPYIISYLSEQRHQLWTYLSYLADQIDSGETEGFDPGSDFAVLLILPHPFAIERIWRMPAGERQVEPGGAMLLTYHRQVVDDEEFMYLHQAARHYPPTDPPIKPVVSGFEPPPLLR